MLSWVVEERAAELLQGHEALDELIVLPRGWLKSPRQIWQLRRRLRACRFDLALEAQGLTKSAVAAWLSGAKRRIGFGGRWGRELSPWLNTELVDAADRHAVAARAWPCWSRWASNRRRSASRSPSARPMARLPRPCCGNWDWATAFALINVGAGWPSKLWPADRFAAVAAHLGRDWALPSLVVWGNAEERRAGRAGRRRLATATPVWPPR